MIKDSSVRTSLWVTAPMNLAAATVLAFPMIAPGQMLGLPPEAAPIYRGVAAYMIGFFGGIYFWLALQPQIDRGLLYAGALGKAGFVLLAVTLWLAGAAPGTIAAAATADLPFAVLWLAWLREN